jgi:short-subunit dehydrogenase
MKIALLYFATVFIIITGYSQSNSMTMHVFGAEPLNSAKLPRIDSSDFFNNKNAVVHNSGKSESYALVAGGSKGIGYAIAEALAKRGYNLILIARHADSLIAAKNKLELLYQIHVEILAFDLSRDESATEIAKWCTEKNIPLKMLCNVAGFGGARDYLSLPLDTLRYMINLNVGSAMSLTLTLLPLLEKNAPS